MAISKLSKNGAVRESASALIDKTNEVIDAVNASGGSDLILGIKDITRNGTTFTATRIDGTTFTFTQQDNDTTDLASMTGTLPIARGGTGATTKKAAAKALTGWEFDVMTANSTDAWVLVTNGSGQIQHRATVVRESTEASTSFDFFSSTTSVNTKGWLVRRGGMVGFYALGIYIKSSSNRVTIGQVPSGWRPPGLFFGITGNSQKFGIEPNGGIWVDAESANNAPIWMSATWPLA